MQKQKLLSTLWFMNSNYFIYQNKTIFSFIPNALKKKKKVAKSDCIPKRLK